MLLINFSHPLTDEQLAAIEKRTGQAVAKTLAPPVQFDNAQPFAEQVARLIDAVDLTPVEWQTAPILVVPPSLNYIALLLLAELHGRLGYFPACVRLRPVADALPPRFEVAEILNLQAIRDAARTRRHSPMEE